jgi:hypothetical protein
MNDVVIGILCYVNRSGSTLLSRMINDLCRGIYVFPELSFPVDVFLSCKTGREISGVRLYDLISRDLRTSAMGIPEDVLKAVCLRHSTSNPASLFIDLAIAKLGRRPAGIVIKHEKLAFLLDTIDIAIPQARYIHIVRDPRAVANSMLSTPVPEKPGFNMARGSILYPARHWVQYIAILNNWRARRPVLEIRYEDLRKDDGQGACLAIAAAMGTQQRSPVEDLPPPAYKVATIDHALHTKIHDTFDERRTSGWRTELLPRHIWLVERTCQHSMNGFGYPPIMGSGDPVSMTVANLIHRGAMLRHVMRSVLRHLRRGDGVRAIRAQTALLRSKRSQLMSESPNA